MSGLAKDLNSRAKLRSGSEETSAVKALKCQVRRCNGIAGIAVYCSGKGTLGTATEKQRGD